MEDVHMGVTCMEVVVCMRRSVDELGGSQLIFGFRVNCSPVRVLLCLCPALIVSRLISLSR